MRTGNAKTDGLFRNVQVAMVSNLERDENCRKNKNIIADRLRGIGIRYLGNVAMIYGPRGEVSIDENSKLITEATLLLIAGNYRKKERNCRTGSDFLIGQMEAGNAFTVPRVMEDDDLSPTCIMLGSEPNPTEDFLNLVGRYNVTSVINEPRLRQMFQIASILIS